MVLVVLVALLFLEVALVQLMTTIPKIRGVRLVLVKLVPRCAMRLSFRKVVEPWILVEAKSCAPRCPTSSRRTFRDRKTPSSIPTTCSFVCAARPSHKPRCHTCRLRTMTRAPVQLSSAAHSSRKKTVSPKTLVSEASSYAVRPLAHTENKFIDHDAGRVSQGQLHMLGFRVNP